MMFKLLSLACWVIGGLGIIAGTSMLLLAAFKNKKKKYVEREEF